MSKLQKSKEEIEALVMAAAAKIRECEGLTGVTVRPIADERVSYNWEVSHLHNNTTHLCQVAISTIVDGIQRVFDLES